MRIRTEQRRDFRFVPRQRVPGRVIFVSAISTVTLWFIAQKLFGIYIAHAVTLEEVYGAYLVGTAAVLWIYAASITFIMGAVVGQLYWERLGIELISTEGTEVTAGTEEQSRSGSAVRGVEK